MGIDPDGEVIFKTSRIGFSDEIVTVDLKKKKRKKKHGPTDNRRLNTVIDLLNARKSC